MSLSSLQSTTVAHLPLRLACSSFELHCSNIYKTLEDNQLELPFASISPASIRSAPWSPNTSIRIDSPSPLDSPSPAGGQSLTVAAPLPPAKPSAAAATPFPALPPFTLDTPPSTPPSTPCGAPKGRPAPGTARQDDLAPAPTSVPVPPPSSSATSYSPTSTSTSTSSSSLSSTSSASTLPTSSSESDVAPTTPATAWSSSETLSRAEGPISSSSSWSKGPITPARHRPAGSAFAAPRAQRSTLSTPKARQPRGTSAALKRAIDKFRPGKLPKPSSDALDLAAVNLQGINHLLIALHLGGTAIDLFYSVFAIAQESAVAQESTGVSRLRKLARLVQSSKMVLELARRSSPWTYTEEELRAAVEASDEGALPEASLADSLVDTIVTSIFAALDALLDPLQAQTEKVRRFSTLSFSSASPQGDARLTPAPSPMVQLVSDKVSRFAVEAALACFSEISGLNSLVSQWDDKPTNFDSDHGLSLAVLASVRFVVQTVFPEIVAESDQDVDLHHHKFLVERFRPRVRTADTEARLKGALSALGTERPRLMDEWDGRVATQQGLEIVRRYGLFGRPAWRLATYEAAIAGVDEGFARFGETVAKVRLAIPLSCSLACHAVCARQLTPVSRPLSVFYPLSDGRQHRLCDYTPVLEQQSSAAG